MSDSKRDPWYPGGDPDAMHWVEEFDRTYPDRRPDNDTMLGWFANAIETGRMVGARAADPPASADVDAALTDAIESQNLYHGRHGTTPAGEATARAILSCLRNHHGLELVAIRAESEATVAALREAARQVDRSQYAISHGSMGGPSALVATAALNRLRAALAAEGDHE